MFGGEKRIDNYSTLFVLQEKEPLILHALLSPKLNFIRNNEFVDSIICRLAERFITGELTQNIRDDHKEKCFIVHSGAYKRYGDKLLDCLRTYYPGCFCICYFTDLIEKTGMDISRVAENYDAVCSFDLEDAQKNGISYLDMPFEYYDLSIDEGADEYDITYVGRAKDRLDDIVKVYEKLSKAGWNCDFHIYGVARENQVYADKIRYNEFMRFEEVLRHVAKSKSVLEISQKNAYSPTVRYKEALLYGKTLFTDSGMLENSNIDNVKWYKNIKDIDFDRRMLESYPYEKYKELFGIECFISAVSLIVTEKRDEPGNAFD
ncbi:MAG: hypothetical protein E7307_00420 [Butyrivibrio sp.]|nr:hypothetical protein [Butyrivibrio sp.]